MPQDEPFDFFNYPGMSPEQKVLIREAALRRAYEYRRLALREYGLRVVVWLRRCCCVKSRRYPQNRPVPPMTTTIRPSGRLT
jgi:hypothetical protein